MPWWVYGPRGMQLWFPLALQAADPSAEPSPNPAARHPDIELQFDKEVYPVGSF